MAAARNVGLALAGVEPEILLRAVGLLQQTHHLAAQDGVQLGRVHVLVARHALLDAADDLHRRIHPHVGGDEHLLQVVQHGGIDRRTARHGPRQFGEKTRLGAFQPRFKAARLRIGHLRSTLRAPVGHRRSLRPQRLGLRGMILLFSEKIEKSHSLYILCSAKIDKNRGITKPRFQIRTKSASRPRRTSATAREVRKESGPRNLPSAARHLPAPEAMRSPSHDRPGMRPDRCRSAGGAAGP